MPRPLALLALFFAGCVTKEDELASLDRDGDGFLHPAAEALGEAGPFDCDDADDSVHDGITFFRDIDGDGFGDEADTLTDCEAPSGYVAVSGDCDDTNEAWNPDAVETCDGNDEDCDGDIDDGFAGATYYPDVDEDGFGDQEGGQEACQAPEGWISEGGDCDDAASDVHPDADELCNSEDDDCDGTPDDGLTESTWYADADGDGHGDGASSSISCAPASGEVAVSGDCDDTESAIHPAATEVCNGVDDDCDGSDDDGITIPTWYRDSDADGYGDDTDTQTECDAPSGYVSQSGDCDDANADFNPGATETDCTDPADYNCDGSSGFADADADGYPACEDCDDTEAAANPGETEACDGFDNDCDGSTDEGLTSTWYVDSDGDSYGTTSTITACGRPSGTATVSTDCDDASASDYPGASEVAANGDDEDCDGVDSCYDDDDNDTYGGTTVVDSSDLDCSDSGESTVSTDCDDGSSSAFPGATETCDGEDDDCDGTIDEGLKLTLYRDADGDGYGSSASSTTSCTTLSGYVTNSTDCDDASASDYPGATETIANGDDEDCSGGDSCYTDSDKDLYGSSAALVSSDLDCTDSGESSLSTDCDDTSSTIKPGGTETCNSTDDDCDGSTDEGVTTTYYRDADGDTYGVSTTTTAACSLPSGYATRSTDCDDTSASDYPSASESVANGDDEDCDGVDSCYDDNDGDGYGGTTVVDSLDLDCTDAGESSLSSDCDDTTSSRYPDLLEICDDSVDQDCDGTVESCALTGTISASSAYDVRLQGQNTGDEAGKMIARAGDLDGDGYDDLVVGVPDYSTDDGRVYVLNGPFSSSISLGTADAIIGAATADDQMGKSVDGGFDYNGDGYDDIIMGSPNQDYTTSADVGAAYVFFGPVSTTSPTSGPFGDISIFGENANDYAGTAVAGAGDINGDSYADLLIGAYGYDDGSKTTAGVAYLVLGTASTTGSEMLVSADAKMKGSNAGDAAGVSVGSAGDVDGDGVDDVIIGANGYDSGSLGNAGAVYLLLGPVSGTFSLSSSTADAVRTGGAAGDAIGLNVAGGGDVDADGYADVATGGLGYSTTDGGAVYLWYGPISGSASATSADAVLYGEALQDNTASVAIDGDYDGDGNDDVLVGGADNDAIATSSGKAYLFQGPVSGTMKTSTGADAEIRGSAAGYGLGYSVAWADLNNDGYADVLAGAPGESSTYSYGGAILGFLGGP